MDKEYQICKYCIMDTTDYNIRFDENGYCNHCRNYIRMESVEKKKGNKEIYLSNLLKKIKGNSRKKYDCVIGISGGIDSSYLAYFLKEHNIRPLAVHLDNGWNSELSVQNIKNLLEKLGIDLYTVVLDWESFKDLQLSFLYASVPDGEIPTDHAIFATLYKIAFKYKIKYIISGENMVTEGILPKSWTYGINDWRYIHGVHKIFGKMKPKKYPHYNIYQLNYYNKILGINFIRLLNYIDYNKDATRNLLQTKFDWKSYEYKHFESIYTRFFQGYILPQKFNIDKRRAHLSTLICSKQITREQALDEISRQYYSEIKQKEDKDYVLKKLGLTNSEFEKIMNLPPKTYLDYPNYCFLITRIKYLLCKIGFKINEFDR